MLYTEFLRHSCMTTQIRHTGLYIFIASPLYSFAVYSLSETKINFDHVTPNIVLLIIKHQADLFFFSDSTQATI